MKRLWLFYFLSLFSHPLPLPHSHQTYIPIDDREDAPFISQRTFTNISDFLIDQHTPCFDPDWVERGDIIYVEASYLSWFEKEVHDQIQVPYILISRVEDWSRPGIGKKLIHDPKCAAWFCWNLLFSFHPKLFPIPMGQGVFSWSDEGREQLLEQIEHPQPKKHLLYMNHCPRSFGDRDKLVPLFENKPYCFSKNHSNEEFKMIDKGEYLADLSASYFVLSPIGLAIECLRTWEAVVVKTIPILLHSFQDPLYEGLPVLLVHDWEEITPALLEKKYDELIRLKPEKAYADYWIRQVLETQSHIREGAQEASTLFSKKDLEDLMSILGDTRVLVYKGLLTAGRPAQLPIETVYLDDPWALEEGDVEGRAPVFLDLAYFRSSLFRPDRPYWQHSLQADLKELYESLPKETLLCGNKAHDSYVREVLQRLAWPIQEKGDFWFLRRL